MNKLSSIILALAVILALTAASVYAEEPNNTAALKVSGEMSFKGISLEVKSILACWSKGRKELDIALLPVAITNKENLGSGLSI